MDLSLVSRVELTFSPTWPCPEAERGGDGGGVEVCAGETDEASRVCTDGMGATGAEFKMTTFSARMGGDERDDERCSRRGVVGDSDVGESSFGDSGVVDNPLVVVPFMTFNMYALK